jgi:hypothetical protein
MDMATMAFGWHSLSTEFRFQNITDDTGVLGLFDWQILKLNFYSEDLRFAIGGGFVSIIDMSLTYFEWSMLFEAYLVDKLMKLSMEYRDATRIDAPSFRREISIFVDYDLTPKWKSHFSPMAGVRYQNYFGNFHQWFFELGMVVRVF